MTDQTVTVNVHRPRVAGIKRYPESENVLAVSLGSAGYRNGDVTLFVTDEGWAAMVDAVAAFLAAEKIEVTL